MNRSIFLIIVFIIYTASIAFAQDDTKLDSLFNLLSKAKNTNDSVDALALIGYNYANKNPDAGIPYCDTALMLAQKANYLKGIADSYNNVGWLYCRKGDYKKSEALLLKALEYFNKVGNPAYPPVVYSNLGWVYLSQADYSAALKSFLKCLDYAQSVHDTNMLAYHNYNIGVIYNRQEKIQEARKYFEISLKCYQATGARSKMSDAYQSLGNTYNSEGDYVKAMDYYMKSYNLIANTNDEYKKGMIHENIGDLYFRQKKYRDALYEYHFAEEKYKSINLQGDIAYINTLISKTCMEMRDFDRALFACLEGLAVAEKINDNTLRQEFYQTISEIYKEKQDYKNAYEFYQRSSSLKDSLFTADRADELMKLQTQFETDRKEKENKILRAENEITLATLQRNRLSLIASIAGLIVLVFTGLLLRRNYIKEKKHSKELYILNEELKNQRSEIEQINRKLEMKALRSQMNPHFIFNCLNSLQECILREDIDKANQYLAKFSRLLRMILESSDEDFIPLSRELEILDLYLTMEAGRLMGSFDYAIVVDPLLDDEEVEVPSLLLQPLVENAIWHGLAGKSSERKLKVEVRQESDHILCIVEDNGIGRTALNKIKDHRSKGISIVTERIRLLNSNHPESSRLMYDDLKDSNGNNSGTRVSLQFPVLN